MKLFYSHTTSIVSFVLLLCVSVSFIWCSDTACQNEEENDCTCLLCLLNADNTSHASTGRLNNVNPCGCVCQMIATFCSLDRPLVCRSPQPATIAHTSTLLPGSTRRILRPPILQALSAKSHKHVSRSTILEKKLCDAYSYGHLLS